MPTANDYLHSFQNAFLERRMLDAQRETIGAGGKRNYQWAWLGMLVSCGRWDGFLSASQKSSAIDTLLLYANVAQVETYPIGGCLYEHKDCGLEKAYFTPVTDYQDGEMIKGFEFKDGVLTIITNRATYPVTIRHNELAGLQGGKPLPKEYYHLNKAVHDSLNVVPSIPATASLNVAPASGTAGTPLTPSISIGYNPGTDTLVSHTLTRNGTGIPLAPLIPAGGTQTLSDIAISDNATYIYTVNVQGKPPATATRAVIFGSQVFYGAANDAVSASMVLAGANFVQGKANFQVSYTANEQFMYVAYPESWGPLASILNPNSFEQLPAFIQDGYPQVLALAIGANQVNYRVYRNNLSVTISGFAIRFLF